MNAYNKDDEDGEPGGTGDAPSEVGKTVKMFRNNRHEMKEEEIAIERIRKFGKLCDKVGTIPICGFSGGKDSAVVYDLAKRSGIKFIPRFNHTFEPPWILRFIKEKYPEVEWFRGRHVGFLANFKNHGNMLPSPFAAYCCQEYKHAVKGPQRAVILGVRRTESRKRVDRTTFQFNPKKLKGIVSPSDYFQTQCISESNNTELILNPIVDWTKEQVMDYIKRHSIPIPKEAQNGERVGCIVCPKADFRSNVKNLYRYPKLVDAISKACGRRTEVKRHDDDFPADEVYFVCRWLNYGFKPFTKPLAEEYRKFRQFYDDWKNKTKSKN